MQQPHDSRVAATLVATVQPVALRVPVQAAAALGVSADFFDEHVLPDLRIVRRGRLKLVAVRELERWIADNAALTLEGDA